MMKQILAALAQADAVYVAGGPDGDSPLLGSFPTELDENGDLIFDWEDNEGDYRTVIPGSSLDNATCEADGFNLLDEDDNQVVLSPYTLQKLW